MYFGWISCEKSKRKELEAIGIKLGKYDSTCFRNCIVPDGSYGQLEEMAGSDLLFLLDYCQESSSVS